MTREEAIAIIRKEYLCVDRDCDIERSCGRCDLMMPSKEPILQAYKMAIDALEQEPYDDTKYHEEHGEVIVDKAVWEDAKRALEQEPTGHWIDNHNNTISCDHCHTWFKKDDRYGYMHYCPYCNTKMVEPQESEDKE